VIAPGATSLKSPPRHEHHPVVDRIEKAGRGFERGRAGGRNLNCSASPMNSEYQLKSIICRREPANGTRSSIAYSRSLPKNGGQTAAQLSRHRRIDQRHDHQNRLTVRCELDDKSYPKGRESLSRTKTCETSPFSTRISTANGTTQSPFNATTSKRLIPDRPFGECLPCSFILLWRDAKLRHLTFDRSGRAAGCSPCAGRTLPRNRSIFRDASTGAARSQPSLSLPSCRCAPM
jgi:hypothetical protein